MMRKKILFICGSLNQTSIGYQISQHLKDYDLYFSPYYSDGYIKVFVEARLLDFTILGPATKKSAEKFLIERNCQIDYQGKLSNYDLVVTCSDLVIPKNIKTKRIILVQEGMTDPENLKFHIVRTLKLPRYLGNTSMLGLSHSYEKLCVASTGFKELFVKKGINPEKISVTGIPNFDNVQQFFQNDFPHKDYVLAATSHLRESLKFENRKKFILNTLEIANGNQVIFKLHPSENKVRAIREIRKYAPQCIVYADGNTNHMIANCKSLVTKYSSVLLVALALGKKIFSDLEENFLKSLTPIQNNGRSAINIANICKSYLE